MDDTDDLVDLGARRASDSEDEVEFVRCVDGLEETGERGMFSFSSGELIYARVKGWFWCR